jgi:DHA2 family multidrug resistance protein
MLAAFHRTIRAVAAFPVPVAALVEGRCLGGAFELALACHYLFAKESAVFACPEVKLGVVPPVLAVLGLYLFVAHILTHPAPFVQPRLFVDRNFAAGLATAFALGVMLLATTTLLPPFLQGLMGYPVFDTGLLLAPRGIGTALAMIAVGRIGDRVDPRLLILLGLGLCAASLHAMTGFDTDVTPRLIVITGVIQGLGIGFVFPPLTTVAFTSSARRRARAFSASSRVT